MIRRIAALTVLTAGSVALLSPADASAQYAGPGAAPTLQSVAQVLKDAKDDQNVSLKGMLIKKVGSEKYTFKDDSGEIRVEIDSEDFPKVSVDEKTVVQITGEVEKDFMESPEIDVDTLTVAQ